MLARLRNSIAVGAAGFDSPQLKDPETPSGEAAGPPRRPPRFTCSARSRKWALQGVSSDQVLGRCRSPAARRTGGRGSPWFFIQLRCRNPSRSGFAPKPRHGCASFWTLSDTGCGSPAEARPPSRGAKAVDYYQTIVSIPRPAGGRGGAVKRQAGGHGHRSSRRMPRTSVGRRLTAAGAPLPGEVPAGAGMTALFSSIWRSSAARAGTAMGRVPYPGGSHASLTQFLRWPSTRYRTSVLGRQAAGVLSAWPR